MIEPGTFSSFNSHLGRGVLVAVNLVEGFLRGIENERWRVVATIVAY